MTYVRVTQLKTKKEFKIKKLRVSAILENGAIQDGWKLGVKL